MQININPYANIVPKIYAYTTPEIARHNGWTKIGYTEQPSVKKRIEQQTKQQTCALTSNGSRKHVIRMEAANILQTTISTTIWNVLKTSSVNLTPNGSTSMVLRPNNCCGSLLPVVMRTYRLRISLLTSCAANSSRQ